jgi:hypothetical protein
MATLNQNFTKFEEDTFFIQFTITDVDTDLTDYNAYWACHTSPTSSGDPLSVKTSGSWDNISSIGGAEWTAAQTIRISISQSDFIDGPLNHGTLQTGSFYHELVIGSLDNGDDSVAVSNGTFTIDPSIFTEKGGR